MRLLTFTLNEIQLREVKVALTKLEGGHRVRVVWIDDYSFNGNKLSIHALDLLSVLSHCLRDSENEMDLFRLRKSAMDQLSVRLQKTQDEIKRQNIDMWLGFYQKLWPGADSYIDLTQPPPQPVRIEPIP